MTKNASAAANTVVDTASDAAAAAGLAYAPREGRREYRPRNDYGDDGRSGPPTGRSGERRSERDFSRETPVVQPSTGLYIGNLLFEVTEEDLQREFSQFGTIRTVTIARDARNLSKGYVSF